MGLDQYAGFRDLEGNVQERFYWRKHARLQKFMAKEFDLQNGKILKHDIDDNLKHLGFNGGQGGVIINDELINRLKTALTDGYYSYFVSDGFFWGQQSQEQQVKKYKKQDKRFVDWCQAVLDNNQDERIRISPIGYDCSW
ncbi:MAG: hypothetical protein O3A39_06800 [Proteobacteria bacterium]|nr:hypothetical protein [Pseudomonadota bacterium]